MFCFQNKFTFTNSVTGRWFVELLPIVFTKVLSKFGQMLKNPIFVQVEIHCNFRFKNIVILAFIESPKLCQDWQVSVCIIRLSLLLQLAKKFVSRFSKLETDD